MPELPEVESLRRSLKPVLGARVLDIEIRGEKIVSGSGTKRYPDKSKTAEFKKNIKGREIKSIERIAKNLIFKLDGGQVILVHLKMTGQLVFVSNKNKRVSGGHPIQESEMTLPHKHTYIIFKLDNGVLYYNDVRQFGYVLYYKDEKTLAGKNHFKNVSMEPFSKEFTYKYFKESILKKNKPIKIVFLNQEIVNGLGNIYADEVCFASSVLPMRRCATLKESEIKSLYKNIKVILEREINSGGSSVANYLLGNGKKGNYANFHRAYKQTGKPCKFPKCKGAVEKINFAGRGTHFCPVHQK